MTSPATIAGLRESEANGAPSPPRNETAAERQHRIARSREILAGIEAKIQRLQHAREIRLRALNAATFRGLDHGQKL
jgi:hypothetical protein